MKRLVICLVILLAVSGCADTMTFAQAAEASPVGFWWGLWHGMTFPFAWVGSLFWSDIAVYAIYNNGGWYDFGFFLGVTGLSSGTSTSYTSRRR